MPVRDYEQHKISFFDRRSSDECASGHKGLELSRVKVKENIPSFI